MSEHYSIKHLLTSGVAGTGVILRGWIRTNRSGKHVSFINLNDGSNLGGLQIVYSAEALENHEAVSRLLTGACIEVEGELVASQGQGQQVEVQAQRVTIIGTCDDSFPLQKKRHSFEYLRTMSHLRIRTNTFGAVFRVRHQLAYAIHRFFHERGFYWIHTPILTASDCEGAGEMFQVTTLDLKSLASETNDAFGQKRPLRKQQALHGPNDRGTVDYSKDFFGRPSFLTVSGQLNVETLCMGLGKVYTFGPTFRAENSNTTRHASEFWMVEPELAFCDLAGDADLAEDFLKFIIRDVLENCQEDMAFFDQWVSKGIVSRLEALVNSRFERMSYTEAVRLLEKSGHKFEYPVSWGAELQTEHERWITEKHLQAPVFVTDYPMEAKAFYMRQNDDGKTVAAMDLLVPGVGEIIGGSQREERLDLLLQRIRDLKLDEEAYWWYLDTRRFGTAPHAGFGLGFERAIMYITGMENIRDVIPFPRTPGNCDF